MQMVGFAKVCMTRKHWSSSFPLQTSFSFHMCPGVCESLPPPPSRVLVEVDPCVLLSHSFGRWVHREMVRASGPYQAYVSRRPPMCTVCARKHTSRCTSNMYYVSEGTSQQDMSQMVHANVATLALRLMSNLACSKCLAVEGNSPQNCALLNA